MSVPTRMLAARLYGSNDLRVEELPVPSPRAGELLLRVRRALLCGTDLRMLRHGTDKARLPLVLGHELAGQVAAAGAGATGWAAGDAVTVAPNMGCGRCASCAAGQTHLCDQYRAIGIHLDGALAEFVRIPAAFLRQGNVAAVPEGVNFEAAALAEPLSCVVSAFDRLRIAPGETVVVFGAGAIGVMHAMLARQAGAKRVVVTDPQQRRLARCAELDGQWVTVEPGSLAARVADLTAGRGADACITACPAPEAQVQAVDLAGLNGRVCFFGGLPAGSGRVLLDTNRIHYRQLVVTGTTRSSPAQFRQALRLIAAGLRDIGRLVTSRFPLRDIHAAVDCAAGGEGWKTAITFD